MAGSDTVDGVPDGIASVRFARLPEADLAAVAALLAEPRNRRHLPLASPMSEAEVADWVRAKDAQWEQNELGPWAFLDGGELVGWGGLQLENGDADLALVLAPRHRGRGDAIADEVIRRGFEEFGLRFITAALPISRRRADAVMARLGFVPSGSVDHESATFALFRLDEESWRRHRGE